MKSTKFTVIFLVLSAFTVGCNKEATPAQQVDKVQVKADEAAQDMKDYSYAQKAEFTAKMQTQLDALDKDVAALSAKIDKADEKARAEAKPKLQALREQNSKLGQQLDDVKNATESTWDSVKTGVKKAYESSKNGFNDARQWVSDKIAP